MSGGGAIPIIGEKQEPRSQMIVTESIDGEGKLTRMQYPGVAVVLMANPVIDAIADKVADRVLKALGKRGTKR